MRVVFLGTPEFAVPALQKLLDQSYEICGVFTQPDRPSGRGQKPQPSPVKILAQAKGIPVFQPEKIRREENHAIFADLRPDFIVTAAYGQILPGWLLQSARLAPVNIHGSLLPRYRGAAPIPWAILNGEEVTGITTMIMQESLDSGPILLQQEVPIPVDKTAGELTADLAIVAADLLVRTLEGLERKTIRPVEQDESLVTWAPPITQVMARISWGKSAREIHNQVRAMNPWPGAHTVFRGERLQIWRSLPENRDSDSQNQPGMLVGFSSDGIQVQCGEGTMLNVLELQKPGRSRISGREFANGVRLRPGDVIFQPQVNGGYSAKPQ
jgi:methionyl-tRNA formyltransferase